MSSLSSDDDPGMLMSVKRLLRTSGYDTVLFMNHVDFEDACCVVLDINLGDGSGIELRHRLNDAGILVPVIYMTGKTALPFAKLRWTLDASHF
jgi:FixJ family two-component response regulator